MSVNSLDALMLKKMFLAGAKYLDANKELINDLNVFPVPDGDTGSNMTMTVMSAANMLADIVNPNMKEFAKAVSGGSLRGARGNSGVIVSQLFRGFAKSISDKKELNQEDIALALEKAVETAFKAVIQPKEGTILSVAKAVAKKAGEISGKYESFDNFFTEVIIAGDEALEYTPEQLPVLKEAGVVDSGGKGLMTILHGAVDYYLGKDIDISISKMKPEAPASPIASRQMVSTDEVKFGYCTEFIVLLEKDMTTEQEVEFRVFLESIGESIVLVRDGELVKIHVHTNEPGNALQKGLEFGQLINIKIDNLFQEHEEQLKKAGLASKETPAKAEPKKNAFIAVVSGDGLGQIFFELGADFIISGGQTMNPSTDDIIKAIDYVNAENVFILPNNKNIILTANQAKNIVSDCNVVVIPTKTVPQGITALLTYDESASADENFEALKEAAAGVKTGEITYAVRNTSLNKKKIKKGDYMGIGDEGIMAVGKKIKDVIIATADELIDENTEIVTLYNGEGFTDEEIEECRAAIEEKYPDVDVSANYGGQPVYYCIMSVE
ncbi:MAG: DAK2 domain-containing protein [Lachnospiraceae bacterium]